METKNNFARISVNIPTINGCFDYHISENLQGTIHLGSLVEVPFNDLTVQGVVIELLEHPDVADTKDILESVDPVPVINWHQIQFARMIASRYFCSLAQAIELMLPPGLSQHVDSVISRVDTADTSRLSGFENQIMQVIDKSGVIRGRQLTAALPKLDWSKAVKRMQKAGIVEVHSYLPRPTVKPKLVRTVQLSGTQQEVDAYLEAPRKGSKAFERRKNLLDFLISDPSQIPVQWVYAETGCTMADLQNLAEADLVILGETEWIRDPLSKLEAESTTVPTLTKDQTSVWDQIAHQIEIMEQGKGVPPILLHGVTGSGKTELYIRAAEKVIASGKKVIILVPEISLTPQTVRRFVNRFPGRVGLYHSRLSPGERFDTWRRSRAGKMDIMVGPRSALFSPLENVGLIVVDECDDDSYCQSDHGFYYDSRILVEDYAGNFNALCIFGSATPDVSMVYKARENGWIVAHLPERIKVSSGSQIDSFTTTTGNQLKSELPPVKVVDMREELKRGNRSLLSIELQEALRETIRSGEQAILYLNRRGKATYVFCRNCGYAVTCPRCDLPLTSHGDKNELICHQCGYKRGMPLRCPQCDSRAIRQLGTGTETVEAAIHELLPEANTLRLDSETARFKDAHEIILSHFVNHRADILIGTQMISKGLDFPLVTLVGVIMAETGLSIPDYRANERTFQLLTQVAGRAGRSDRGGKVIFQTYQPDHYVIRHAAKHDHSGFYTEELEHRRKLGYPPFYQIVRVEISDLSNDHARKKAQDIYQKIMHWVNFSENLTTEVIGPVPCYYGKMNNQYRWQIVLRGKDPSSLLKDHSNELINVHVEIDPPNLL